MVMHGGGGGGGGGRSGIGGVEWCRGIEDFFHGGRGAKDYVRARTSRAGVQGLRVLSEAQGFLMLSHAI